MLPFYFFSRYFLRILSSSPKYVQVENLEVHKNTSTSSSASWSECALVGGFVTMDVMAAVIVLVWRHHHVWRQGDASWCDMTWSVVANTIVVLILGQRRRRWANMKTTLFQWLVFASVVLWRGHQILEDNILMMTQQCSLISPTRYIHPAITRRGSYSRRWPNINP